VGYSLFVQWTLLHLSGGSFEISLNHDKPFPASFYPFREFLIEQIFSDVI
jgi:hypothetical protein